MIKKHDKMADNRKNGKEKQRNSKKLTGNQQKISRKLQKISQILFRNDRNYDKIFSAFTLLSDYLIYGGQKTAPADGREEDGVCKS